MVFKKNGNSFSRTAHKRGVLSYQHRSTRNNHHYGKHRSVFARRSVVLQQSYMHRTGYNTEMYLCNNRDVTNKMSRRS